MKSIHINVDQGEILALIGLKGSDKSSFLRYSKTLTREKGYNFTIFHNTTELTAPTRQGGEELLVEIVSSRIDLVPNLNVAENIFLERQCTSHLGRINWPKLYAKTHELLQGFSMQHISPTDTIEDLSYLQKLMISIAKALSYNIEILILDEIMEKLDEDEITYLFDKLHVLKKLGFSIIYIPFKIEEVMRIADKVAITYKGSLDGDPLSIKESSFEQIMNRMMGKNKKANIFTDSFLQKYHITDREQEIIAYIAKGYSNQAISEMLKISLGTVKNHIYNIFQKTNVKNRMELNNLLKLQ